MPTVENIIIKMNNAPNTIKFTEIQKVLESIGYVLVRQKGSHAQFRNSEGTVITIKKDSTIKAVYVKDVLKRIGAVNDNRR